VRPPGQVSGHPPAVPALDEGQTAVQCAGDAYPAGRSGKGGLQAVAQPVWLQEQGVVNREQANAGGLNGALHLVRVRSRDNAVKDPAGFPLLILTFIVSRSACRAGAAILAGAWAVARLRP
jgi:hypothetical protein